MTTYHLDDAEFQALKGNTIIVTGAASGIGRAVVQIAHNWNEAAGEALEAELNDPSHILFHRTDVSSWPSVLSLFDAALRAFSTPDAALSNAGVNAEDFAATDPATGALLPLPL